MFQRPSMKYEDVPNEELRKAIKEQGLGSLIIYTEGDFPILQREVMVCLNHPVSITPMVSKELVSSFRLRYIDTA